MVPLENLSVRKSVKQSKKFCFEIYNPELEKNKDKPKIKSCKKTKEGADGTAPLPFDFVSRGTNKCVRVCLALACGYRRGLPARSPQGVHDLRVLAARGAHAQGHNIITRR